MPERTYTGHYAPAGVQFPDVFDKDGEVVHAGRTVPYHGGPIEVEDHEAALLDLNPDWGGVAPSDDLDALSKDDLFTVADAEGVEVGTRWGAKRIADAIRTAREGTSKENA